MVLLQLLNVVLIIAIAVVGIVGFFAPTKSISTTSEPGSDAGKQGQYRKLIRIIIPAAVLALIVILIVATSGSLEGAAGGSPLPPAQADNFDFSSVVVISAAVALGGMIALGLILVMVLCAVMIYKASTRARKILAFTVAFLTTLIVLSSLSFFFDWGWNFPDIFGTVGGLLSLALLVNDRFLAK